MTQKDIYTIEDVLSKSRTYIQSEKSLALIKKAYEVANIAHAGQKRMSGEPYITHPLAVGYLLASANGGPNTIAAGILHDVLEDTEVTKEELEETFGKDITSIVEGVTKISKLKYMTEKKALAKTHQKIILAMSNDIRVVLVKLFDRVHNMRTLNYQNPEKQKLIAKETLDLYAPLAGRIGMYRIKAELEDLSFRYYNPERYQFLKSQIKKTSQAQESDLNLMKSRILEILKDSGIKNYEVTGRIKNLYSVEMKMQRKHLEVEEIFDLLALRIIVPTIENCYLALGLIHGEWSPLPGRIKDYIAIPKPNLYQSLHTTVVGIKGKKFEIQIRTKEMDDIAELGVAAHWAYKENEGYIPEKEQLDIAAKLKWYSSLAIYGETDYDDDSDPLSELHEDLFDTSVFVFTPKGDVIDMQKGATPLDFAFRIHSEVGIKTTGAVVNGKMVALSHKLKTGDVVSIITSKNSPGPNDSWLKIAKTNNAKHKIISFLNKKKRDEYIQSGRNELEHYYKEDSNFKPTDKDVSEKFSKQNIGTLEDLLFEIGKGVISPKGAYNVLTGKNVFDDQVFVKEYLDNSKRQEQFQVRQANNQMGIFVEGLDKAKIKLAQCCLPVMDDEIIGLVTKQNGIVVHRQECNNLGLDKENRQVEVRWVKVPNKTFTYKTVIDITTFDRKNLMIEIINKLNSLNGIGIISITNKQTKSGDFVISVSLSVNDKAVLDNALVNLKKVADVFEVKRVLK